MNARICKSYFWKMINDVLPIFTKLLLSGKIKKKMFLCRRTQYVWREKVYLHCCFTYYSSLNSQVNRDLLVHLASLVNGKNSRVVRKLSSISRICLDSIEGMSDRCQLASTYNDCLNENMLEFAFPLDIAEEAVRKMPFHLIQPK